MADQALYRKYRSRDFTEVIGQEHVVRTLTAAIASGRFTHAYLFTGPKGVGKTSVARLLARAINCSGSPRPCNACPECLAAINSSLDIVEIDAASNRSIDAVRDLKEKIALAPTRGRYKVYIIDEVHMLTTEAFNALLKTLEEPPAHAVFILATTEAHKVPDTITSRTQAFIFKPITLPDLTRQLQSIADQESIETEADALQLIAQSAKSSFRDAISLLDQLASTGIKPLTVDIVRDYLGYTSAEEIENLAWAITSHNTKIALDVLARLEASGAQPEQVILQLTELWRTIMLITTGAAVPGNDAQKGLADQTTSPAAARIVSTLLDLSRSSWPQLALEAAVVKLTAQDLPVVTTPTTLDSPKSPHSPVQQAPSKPGTVPSDTPDQSPRPAPVAREEPEQVASRSGQLNPDLWPKVLVLVKSQNNSLYALLQMYPVDFAESEVTIKPRFNFHRELFDKPSNRQAIEAAAAKVYGRSIKVSAHTVAVPPASTKTSADSSAELVTSALEILGGEIVE